MTTEVVRAWRGFEPYFQAPAIWVRTQLQACRHRGARLLSSKFSRWQWHRAVLKPQEAGSAVMNFKWSALRLAVVVSTLVPTLQVTFTLSMF